VCCSTQVTTTGAKRAARYKTVLTKPSVQPHCAKSTLAAWRTIVAHAKHSASPSREVGGVAAYKLFMLGRAELTASATPQRSAAAL
jgi:hypothetical protein